jgi:hypothetical protein
MKALLCASAILIGAISAVHAQAQHPCATDARKKADALLKLHFDDGDNLKVSISSDVKALPPVNSLRGKGKFDVLEVWGYIYKAEYRMRFIYAQIKGSCVLMGQEILEAANPY